jgi:hypothetical protein
MATKQTFVDFNSSSSISKMFQTISPKHMNWLVTRSRRDESGEASTLSTE